MLEFVFGEMVDGRMERREGRREKGREGGRGWLMSQVTANVSLDDLRGDLEQMGPCSAIFASPVLDGCLS